MENEQTPESAANTSIVGCLVPVFWMLAGNGILAVCAVAIASKGIGIFSLLDVFYWLTVGCLVAARYADIRYLGGRTTDGTSATMAHWRRYALILVVAVTVVWITAHLIPGIGV